MMTSLLSQFEQQYSTQTAEITAKIGRLQLLSGGERRDGIIGVERLLLDVQDLLDQMELSVREMPHGSADRNKYETRVNSYKMDKKALDHELRKAITRISEDNARDELFGADSPSSSSDRTALTEQGMNENTQRLERSSRKLEEGYRIAVETEEVGADILSNLESQRHTMNRARDRLRETEEEVGQAGKVLTGMIHRLIAHRAALVLILAVSLIVIGLVIYLAIGGGT